MLNPASGKRPEILDTGEERVSRLASKTFQEVGCPPPGIRRPGHPGREWRRHRHIPDFTIDRSPCRADIVKHTPQEERIRVIADIENINHFPDQEYPEGASGESWSDRPGIISCGPFDQVLDNDRRNTPYSMQAEVVSSGATLDPGEEYSFPVYWSPTRVTHPIKDAVWTGAIRWPLEGELAGIVDKTLARPPDAFRVSVFAQDGNGKNRGFLGKAILQPRYC